MGTVNEHFTLRTCIEYFDNFVSLVGLILNLTLLYLIVKRTSNRLKQYRPVLLQNCLIDMFFNIMNAMTKTETDQKEGNFFMLMIGPLMGTPTPYNNILICTWVFALFYQMTSVPVQFAYRYFLIVRRTKLTIFHYCVLLLSAMLAALTYASWTLYTFWPNHEIWIEKSRLLRADSIYAEGIPNFVVASIDEWPLKILFIYAYILVTVSYGLTIFFNVKVYRHLESMKSQMSVQNHDAQKQISRTLIIQALIPGIVILTPIALAVTMAFLHTNIPGIGLLVSFLISIIPLANPLLTLIVVKNYRQTIISTFKNLCKRKIYQNNSAISTISRTRGIGQIGPLTKAEDNRISSSMTPQQM